MIRVHYRWRRSTLALIVLVLLAAARGRAQTVRVGVFGLFRPTELTVAPTPDSTLFVERDGDIVPAGNKPVAVHLVGGGMLVCAEAACWRGSRVMAHNAASASDLVLSVPGKIRRRYRGTIEITPQGNELVAVVTMDLETAVASVVAAESPPGTPLEALKAQAVASRSFLVSRASGHRLFDFCDTTHCQFLRQPPEPDSPAMRATRETRGMVLTYLGMPLSAMFASSCGGRTRTLAELGVAERGYPYFSVECPYCRKHADPWTRGLPRAVHGERERLAFNRQHGWSAFPGNTYKVSQAETGVNIAGTGLGHGLGLCQKGAAAMAAEGRSFREILDHYYPNTVVRAQAQSR